MRIKTYIAAMLLVGLSSTAPAGTYDDLIAAAKSGDAGAVEALIKRGADVDTTDPEGNSLLMLAVRDGHARLVDTLLAQRPKVNIRNSAGDSPLRLAALRGDVDPALAFPHARHRSERAEIGQSLARDARRVGVDVVRIAGHACSSLRSARQIRLRRL